MEFEQIAMVADKEFTVQESITEAGWVWHRDIVTAKGIVDRGDGMNRVVENKAELRFNYEMFPGKEFELLHYIDGENFLGARIPGTMSHFGVHVPLIDDFRDYLANKGFWLVQEVVTIDHTGVPDNRHYHYAIYRHHKHKVAWKLIERLDPANWIAAQQDMNRRYNRDIF
jgi:hypothetical protein